MGLHSDTQLKDKRKAIDTVLEGLAMRFLHDALCDEELFHEIESLNQLVQEYKRG